MNEYKCEYQKSLNDWYKVQNTADFQTILKKALDSVTVPVIISIDGDYSRNHILLNYDMILRIWPW